VQGLERRREKSPRSSYVRPVTSVASVGDGKGLVQREGGVGNSRLASCAGPQRRVNTVLPKVALRVISIDVRRRIRLKKSTWDASLKEDKQRCKKG